MPYINKKEPSVLCNIAHYCRIFLEKLVLLIRAIKFIPCEAIRTSLEKRVI